MSDAKKRNELIKTIRPEYFQMEERGYMDKIYNKISIYFSFLLIKTKISANQITYLMVLIVFGSSILLVLNNYYLDILFVILFNFSYFLDWCDGDVARYRRYRIKIDDKIVFSESVKGSLIDHIYHEVVVVFPLFFITIRFIMLKNYFYSHIALLSIVFFLLFQVISYLIDLSLYDKLSENNIYSINKKRSSKKAKGVLRPFKLLTSTHILSFFLMYFFSFFILIRELDLYLIFISILYLGRLIYLPIKIYFLAYDDKFKTK